MLLVTIFDNFAYTTEKKVCFKGSKNKKRCKNGQGKIAPLFDYYLFLHNLVKPCLINHGKSCTYLAAMKN